MKISKTEIKNYYDIIKTNVIFMNRGEFIYGNT